MLILTYVIGLISDFLVVNGNILIINALGLLLVLLCRKSLKNWLSPTELKDDIFKTVP